MHDLPLLTTIAAAFAAAWILGLITQRLGLSPIVGYLLAGVVIGRHTPGFVGDEHLAQQLAEVGVILLMFGVGLHFHLKDLLAVKGIAIPGAIVQSAVATIVTALAFQYFGWDFKAGLVLGMAMAVASTVVLLRVLMDREMLNTEHGHVAVGWLIAEDVFTVLALVLVPVLAGQTGDGDAGGGGGDLGQSSGLAAIGWAVLKLGALVALVLLGGSRVVPWILIQVTRLRSRELFTLTVLVLSIAIAVGSASLFGASVALGAFLAGMVVAQSPVSHQAAADVLPMRDAFAVLFFVSVGMLFDPWFLVTHPGMVSAGLAVVLIAKPLAALAIVALLGYTPRTALTVAIGLAQIGEFSFILANLATEHKLLPETANNVLVAAAMISITINPLLFRSIDRIERALQACPPLWKLLSFRVNARLRKMGAKSSVTVPASAEAERPAAIIVGYGPVGRVVDAMLRDSGLDTVVIDMNMDTIAALTKSGRRAIYGDATSAAVLDDAGVQRAVHMVITLPNPSDRPPAVLAARSLNSTMEITVRARFLSEREQLRQAGATTLVYEEGEAGVELARRVLERRGVQRDKIDSLLASIRKLWSMQE
ncbi:MAG: cation:proton antiporter [Phycisphaerales bacterium]|nr:cation:proton antiporter [Phycisphaerales bacterium]